MQRADTLGWLSGKRVRLSCRSRGFAPWQGHTKDHHKNGTNCLLAWHAGIRVGVQP